jgi:hypothetical protein
MVRLKMMKSNTTTPSRPAFMVTGNNETRDCSNCGENGHMSRDCRAPRKPNRGRGKEMTVVDQEEVDVRNIGLAKEQMWNAKKRDYLTKWSSSRKS